MIEEFEEKYKTLLLEVTVQLEQFAAKFDEKVTAFKGLCELTSWDTYQQYISIVADFVESVEQMLSDCDKQVDTAFEQER